MKKHIDKSRLEEVRRKKMRLTAAAVIVVATICISVALSHISARNVDTSRGLAAIEELENTDVAEIENQIEELEKAERQEDEDWQNRPLSQKFEHSVVIGDSIASGFSTYGVLSASSVAAEVGMTLTEIGDLLDTAAGLNPENVFFSLGLNDITATAGNTEEFVKNYQSVVDTLREKVPDVEIYINAVLPVRSDVLEDHPEYNDIDAYNKALQSFCEEASVTFVDCTDLVQEDYFEQDGEHFKSDFYTLWGERMAEVAGL